MNNYEKFEFQMSDELGSDHCTVKLLEGAGKIIYGVARKFEQTGERGAKVEFFEGIGRQEQIPETVEMSSEQMCLIDDLVDMLKAD